MSGAHHPALPWLFPPLLLAALDAAVRPSWGCQQHWPIQKCIERLQHRVPHVPTFLHGVEVWSCVELLQLSLGELQVEVLDCTGGLHQANRALQGGLGLDLE